MMTCIPVQMPGGGTAIVCTGRRGRRRCSNKPCVRWASLECDYPDTNRKSGTCDKPLCSSCAVKKGDDLDFCPHHPADAMPGPSQGVLPL